VGGKTVPKGVRRTPRICIRGFHRTPKNALYALGRILPPILAFKQPVSGFKLLVILSQEYQEHRAQYRMPVALALTVFYKNVAIIPSNIPSLKRKTSPPRNLLYCIEILSI